MDLNNEKLMFKEKDQKCSRALQRIRHAISVNKTILYYKARILYAERRLGNQETTSDSENPAQAFIKDVLCVDPTRMPQSFEAFTESVAQGTSEFLKLRDQYDALPGTSNEDSSMADVFEYLKECEIPDGLVQEQKNELGRCFDERGTELMRMRDDANSQIARADEKEKGLQ